jgi:hypothetical protein
MGIACRLRGRPQGSAAEFVGGHLVDDAVRSLRLFAVVDPQLDLVQRLPEPVSDFSSTRGGMPQILAIPKKPALSRSHQPLCDTAALEQRT